MLFKFNNYFNLMKTYISFFLFFGFLFFSQSCSSQSSSDPKAVESLVNSQNFTFYAQRANPTNYDVINVMNSIPNSTSTRILELDGSYTIILKNDTLDVYLPYFGRSFNPSYGSTDKTGYKFVSKDFTVNKSQNKKGNWIIKINPKDVSTVSEIYIEVFKNGKAFTSIKSSDRQPISYDGYVDKNDVNSKP
ncbi:hypothetical protein CHRY9393_00148 [Chryseobacterium fistulae]|uniref:DUF4251 domain-containing protein n=2 Tax=Chryseobacterium fistulae TaxID=2675058 RepID=A0A6N4XPY8_9FLAO|nr:hypothetical protein CHRY9393_00148 [Chryseobacterium fistulae]